MVIAMRTAAVMLALVAHVATLTADRGRAQDPFGDSQVMTKFQRAADSYAFTHRQVERKHGTPPAAVEGAIFTPAAAAAFRNRIMLAVRSVGCERPEPGGIDFSVPRVNSNASATPALSACIVAVLPKLPAELEYRSAGVALLLVDAHTHVVVDVLHAAFGRS